MPTRSVELIKHPMRVRTLEVRGVRKTGPIYQLITLGGDDLADFETLSPTDHVGLVPPTGNGLVLPDVVDDRLRWPEGERPPMREYTVRRFDPEKRELAVRVRAIRRTGKVHRRDHGSARGIGVEARLATVLRRSVGDSIRDSIIRKPLPVTKKTVTGADKRRHGAPVRGEGIERRMVGGQHLALRIDVGVDIGAPE